MKNIGILLGLAAFGVANSVAFAAEPAKAALDDAFLAKAANCQHALIDVSKLADKHAASPKVKELAGEAIKVHEKCYEQLAAIIKDRKVGIVSGLEKEFKDDMDRLSKLKGSEFDKAYLEWLIGAHKASVAMLNAQIAQGKETSITQYAKDALPTAKEHLKHMEEVGKTLGI